VEVRDATKVVTDYYYTTSVETPVLVSDVIAGRPDGSLQRTYDYAATGGATFTPPAPSGYYLTSEVNKYSDGGMLQKTYVYIKPPVNYTSYQTVSFPMPGLATASTTYGVVLDPPYQLRLQASIAVTFATSQTAASGAVPYYDTWSRLYIQYERTSDSQQYFESKALNGYVGNNSATTTTSFAGVDVTGGVSTVVGLVAARPTGTKVLEAQSEPYLTATDGTVVYKNVVTSVTLP
jgi:hypothetical protein